MSYPAADLAVALRLKAFRLFVADHFESFFILALYVATASAQIGDDVSPAQSVWGGLWPASAFATSAMIAAPAHRAFATYAVILVVVTAVQRALGGSWPASLLLGAATASAAGLVARADLEGCWKRIWEAEPSDILGLLAAVAIASLWASTVGVAGLVLLGEATSSDSGRWAMWLLADAVAAVVLVPGLLALAGLRNLLFDSRGLEGAVALLLLTALSYLLLVQAPRPGVLQMHGYLAVLTPVVLWAALRAPPQLSMLAPSVVGGVALWGAADQAGTHALLAGPATADSLAFHGVLVATVILTLIPASLVAQQARIEASRAAVEDRTVRIAETAALGIFEHDHARETLHASDRLRAIFGLPRTDPVTLLDLVGRVIPEDRTKFAAALSGPVADPAAAIEYRISRGEGDVRWLLQGTRPLALLPPGRGTASPIIGTVMDITDFRDGPRAVQARDERRRAMLDAIPGALIAADEQGRIVEFDGAAERMFGYAAQKIVGRDLRTLFPDARALPPTVGGDGQHDGTRRPRGTRASRPETASIETAARRHDGSTFPAELWLRPVQAGEQALVAAFVLDLSERRAVEARLRALRSRLRCSARVRALGRMAPSLAHELIQPLTAVANLAATSRDLMAADGPVDRALLGELLDDIVAQAMRAGQIVRGLREFASQGDGVRNAEILAGLISTAKALALAGHDGQRVEVTSQMDDGVRVLVNRVQIQQVVVNLVRNAVDAMSGESRRELHISARQSDDGWAEVRVADSGPGIGPNLVNRLFEPFVTTKEGGMGLGLSICKDIVEDHGGTLWVEDRHPHGATFVFTLPCLHDEAEHA